MTHNHMTAMPSVSCCPIPPTLQSIADSLGGNTDYPDGKSAWGEGGLPFLNLDLSFTLHSLKNVKILESLANPKISFGFAFVFDLEKIEVVFHF